MINGRRPARLPYAVRRQAQAVCDTTAPPLDQLAEGIAQAVAGKSGKDALFALELEETPHGILPHRLPAWAREQWADPQLLMAEQQPAGVRLRFRTTAMIVELETLPTKRIYAGMPPRPAELVALRSNAALAPDFSTGRVQFLASGNPHESASGKLTLAQIRATLGAIVMQRQRSDPHLHYLDGRVLAAMSQMPTTSAIAFSTTA